MPSTLYLWWSKVAFLIHLLIFLSHGGLLGCPVPYHLRELPAPGSFLLLRSTCSLSLGSGFQSCVLRVRLNFLCLEQAQVPYFSLLTLSRFISQGQWSAFAMLFSREDRVFFLVFTLLTLCKGLHSSSMRWVSSTLRDEYLFSYSSFIFNS